MKVTLALLLASSLVALCHSATTLPKQLVYDAEVEQAVDQQGVKDDVQNPEDERIKRNGGKAIIGFIGERIQSGISNTLQSSIGKIASASSGLLTKKGGSEGHGGGGHSSHEYGPPPSHSSGHAEEGKGFDVWSFKKSIVSTLLQAVKAITGGAIAVGGKVTQGAGHVVEAKGRLLQQAGEQIFGFGKHVSQKAFQPVVHAPAPHHHSSYNSHAQSSFGGYDGPLPIPTATGYAPSGGHIQSAPLVGHFSSYGQSGPGSEYGAPHYQVARSAKASAAGHSKAGKFDTEGAKSGLLILKPINIPALDRSNNQLHHASSEQFQRFAPPPPFQASAFASSDSYQQYQPAAQTSSVHQAPSNNYQQYVAGPQAKSMTVDSYQNFEPARLRKSISYTAPAAADNYQQFAVPPRAVKRSYNVSPMQYQPSLGYVLPDIEYEQ